jgi:hypothetical protein
VFGRRMISTCPQHLQPSTTFLAAVSSAPNTPGSWRKPSFLSTVHSTRIRNAPIDIFNFSGQTRCGRDLLRDLPQHPARRGVLLARLDYPAPPAEVLDRPAHVSTRWRVDEGKRNASPPKEASSPEHLLLAPIRRKMRPLQSRLTQMWPCHLARHVACKFAENSSCKQACYTSSLLRATARTRSPKPRA